MNLKPSYWVKPGAMIIGLLALYPAQAMASGSNYAIEQIRDNVYRFSYEHYHSAFMVTDAGIIVTDPINEEAATWLKSELAERFDAPVRYLVYSHNHGDHVMGGEVFDSDQVTVVAHEFAAQDLQWTQVPTAMPELIFHREMTLNIGDSSVRMQYHGPNNGRGNISMRFMPANVVYVVDWVVLGRMMYKDLDALQQDIRLPEYSGLAMYEEWLPLNIAGVHRTLMDMSYMDRRQTEQSQ